jgi:dTDP-4-amino-4,6-dideoxygalactose transaminase
VPVVGAEQTTPVNVATVPFLDLGPVHAGLKDQILMGLSQLIDSGTFVNGTQVADFEGAFADYCGTSHCVGVASGLDALRLGLLAAGIETGDEVIVPANTFIATLEAVTQAGGRPVLVDASDRDFTIDVAAVEASIGTRTRFVLPVHLYGQMADLVKLLELGASRGLTIVEDSCQAHGAERAGLKAGAAGLWGAFSFYPAKNLGAMGDAGALVTEDADLAAEVKSLREHGQAKKYDHRREGFTARLDTLQALVLLLKLPFLDRWNEERRSAARYYADALTGVGDLRLPATATASNPVWHLYVLRTRDPAALAAFLAERGIQAGRHYPQPAHLSQAYSWLGYSEGAFPVAERLAAEVLSLPIFPGIREQQLAAVAAAITAFFDGG